MTGPAPIKTINVGLGGINVKADRLRALRPDRVAELAEFMKVNGLLQPIVPRTGKGSGYHLVAGQHRFEAARLLKWPSIRANIFEGMKANAAELAEIDENLIHVDLSPAERAMHVARRKELYEELFPETKAKVAGGKARQGAASDKLSFARATARATGKDQRSVQRDSKRGKDIPSEVLSTVIGTSLDKGDELDALANLPPDRRNKLAAKAADGEKVSAKTELKKAKRTDRERELGAKQKALPDKKYGVIYADSEWRFEPWSRETGMDRSADNHYPTSTLEVIKSRPVETIAADDCVLFLWATAPMMPQAVLVMGAWGFDYKSQTMWRKIRPGVGRGTGYWFINEHELLLVGTRGNVPAPAPGTQWPSVIEAPVGEHSDKPEVFAQMIEELFPTMTKIELNRRGPARPGWSAWGLEAEESTPDTD